MRRAVCLALALVVITGSARFAAAEEVDLYDIILSHGDMTEADAKAMEDRLAANADDTEARLVLLGYYQDGSFTSDVMRTAYERHVLWVIEHEPDSPVVGTPWCELDPLLNTAAYAKARGLWVKHVEDRPQDVTILRHAADFFQLHETELAITYLQRGKAIEPQNPGWSEQLGHVYQLDYQNLVGDERRALAAKALAEFEQAFVLFDNDEERFYLLNDIADAAFSAGDLDKAQRNAEQLLEQAVKFPDDWNHGNAIHDGHTVLGRIALVRGDVAAAKTHLLDSARTEGSPQLNSFGPTFDLADELLRRGERDTVVEYLKLCGHFWEMDRGSLARWIKAIEAGQTPRLTRFGA